MWCTQGILIESLNNFMIIMCSVTRKTVMLLALSRQLLCYLWIPRQVYTSDVTKRSVASFRFGLTRIEICVSRDTWLVEGYYRKYYLTVLGSANHCHTFAVKLTKNKDNVKLGWNLCRYKIYIGIDFIWALFYIDQS